MSPIVKTERSWFLILFGACFAIPATLIFALSTVPNLYEAYKMQTWVSAQATLSATELKHYSGDSTTYKATATYHYETDDGRYEGSRVSIHSGSDNIGAYHQEMSQKLQRLRSEKKHVTVYYDPDSPQDSIIDRNIRWESMSFMLIFVILFGGVGFGMVYFGLRGNKTIISPEATAKPWLSKLEWVDNKITSNSKMEVIMYGAFALFWNLISWPMIFFGLEEAYQKEGLWVVALMSIFPLAGLYIIFRFIKSLLQWRRFGKTFLTLNPFPGSIGGQVAGTVAVNAKLSSQDSYKVSLSCINKYTSRSGNKTRTIERQVWQKDSYAQVLLRGASSELAFLFDVPANLPASDIKKSNSYHLWRVKIISKNDYLKREFDIPVFATGTSSSLRVTVPKHHIKNEDATW